MCALAAAAPPVATPPFAATLSAAPPLPRAKPEAPAAPPLPAPKPDPAIRAGPAQAKADGAGTADGADSTDKATEPPAPADAPEPWSAAAIDKAEAACRKALDGLKLTYTPLAPIGGPGECGTPYPVKVERLDGIAIVPPATMNCAMVSALHRWFTESVQPSAKAAFGERVAAIRNASSYVCRRRNNQPDGKFSEHAFANALDVMAFRLGSGETVAIEGGWSIVGASLGMDSEASFLKSVNAGACEMFYTVLGPGANDYHNDHFHLDLARGGRYLICE